jgi:response regulator RpfG family c-di-GMP phosphodiesterase
MSNLRLDGIATTDEQWGLLTSSLLFAPAELGRSQLVNQIAEQLRVFDPDTYRHTAHVTQLTYRFVESTRVSAELVSTIVDAAWVHDIGKVFIGTEVLNRSGPMTTAEWSRMRQHSALAAQLLYSHPSVRELAPIVRHHHEHYDGQGYPDNLSGSEIPIGSRVIAVADAYDSMTSDRPYRQRLTTSAAIAELGRCAGTQFDPVVVEQFIECIGSG